MAKKPQTIPPEVLAAQEALQRAEHERLVAQRELERATQARFEAAQALQGARVHADRDLPRVWMLTPSWGSAPSRSTALVIERRTAKTIVTRSPGCSDERQWRKGADGRWRQWPDRGSVRWLEIEGDAT